MQQILSARRIAVAVLLGSAVACGASFEPGVALTGHWGGNGLILDLTPSGGAIDGTCSSGSLDAPLVPDQAGVVGASGYTVTEGGAPPPPGYVPEHHPVFVGGLVDGDRLRVTVRVMGIAYVDEPPHYDLVRGAPGDVLRCP